MLAQYSDPCDQAFNKRKSVELIQASFNEKSNTASDKCSYSIDHIELMTREIEDDWRYSIDVFESGFVCHVKSKIKDNYSNFKHWQLGAVSDGTIFVNSRMLSSLDFTSAILLCLENLAKIENGFQIKKDNSLKTPAKAGKFSGDPSLNKATEYIYISKHETDKQAKMLLNFACQLEQNCLLSFHPSEKNNLGCNE